MKLSYDLIHHFPVFIIVIVSQWTSKLFFMNSYIFIKSVILYFNKIKNYILLYSTPNPCNKKKNLSKSTSFLTHILHGPLPFPPSLCKPPKKQRQQGKLCKLVRARSLPFISFVRSIRSSNTRIHTCVYRCTRAADGQWGFASPPSMHLYIYSPASAPVKASRRASIYRVRAVGPRRFPGALIIIRKTIWIINTRFNIIGNVCSNGMERRLPARMCVRPETASIYGRERERALVDLSFPRVV